jgi:hypothetical protein
MSVPSLFHVYDLIIYVLNHLFVLIVLWAWEVVV